MQLGSESVNPAKFSEAEQGMVKQGFNNNPFFIDMNLKYLDQALDAYREVCLRGIQVKDQKGNVYSGLLYQQPSITGSKVGWKYVHLRNCNGDIARYNIKTGEITL